MKNLSIAKKTIHLTLDKAKEIFRSRLLSYYVIGSLAHGGFSPLVSDVDIAIITTDYNNADAKHIEQISNFVIKCDLPLCDRISIFWSNVRDLSVSTLKSGRGRFPAIDKLDLLNYGILFYGKDIKNQLNRPEIHNILIDSSTFAIKYLLNDEMLTEIGESELLITRDARKLTKIVLFPIRLLYTLKTHRIGQNEHASNLYIQNN